MGANLQSADLSGAKLQHAIMAHADLTGALLQDADLTDVDLSSANLSGADLSGADLTQTALPDMIDETDFYISHATCHGESITRNSGGYFCAHVLITDDGPDYYQQFMADTLTGIISIIENALKVGVST
jgi:hypothetical protein